MCRATGDRAQAAALYDGAAGVYECDRVYPSPGGSPPNDHTDSTDRGNAVQVRPVVALPHPAAGWFDDRRRRLYYRGGVFAFFRSSSEITLMVPSFLDASRRFRSGSCWPVRVMNSLT